MQHWLEQLILREYNRSMNTKRVNPLSSAAARLLLGFSLAGISLTGCSVTVGSIEGTSDSFANTTEASGKFGEATTDATSSTSPRGDTADTESSDVAEVAMKKAARDFAEANFVQLRRDVAYGGGEYLAAIAEIFEVEQTERAQYFRLSKTAFPEVARLGDDSDAMVEVLFHLSKALNS